MFPKTNSKTHTNSVMHDRHNPTFDDGVMKKRCVLYVGDYGIPERNMQVGLYRWISLNPNVDNLNSRLIRSSVEIICRCIYLPT